MPLRKKDDVAADYDAEVAENHRRGTVNQKLGMSGKHPFAFGLSEEELDEMEESIRDGERPLPWIELDNGLLVLGDPERMALRAHKELEFPERQPPGMSILELARVLLGEEEE